MDQWQYEVVGRTEYIIQWNKKVAEVFHWPWPNNSQSSVCIFWYCNYDVYTILKCIFSSTRGERGAFNELYRGCYNGSQNNFHIY